MSGFSKTFDRCPILYNRCLFQTYAAINKPNGSVCRGYVKSSPTQVLIRSGGGGAASLSRSNTKVQKDADLPIDIIAEHMHFVVQRKNH